MTKDRAPSDKTSYATNEIASNVCAHANIIQSNTISSSDTDSVHLYIDSYVSQGIIGFKSDFIYGYLKPMDHESTETTTGTTSIISESLARHTLINNDGQLHTMTTQMSYSPTSKCRFI